MSKNKTKKAFTLIELLIVISIISVLALMGLSSFGSVREDSRNAKRKADLRDLQKALESYRTRHGFYPETPVGGGPSGHRWRGICANYGGMDDSGATGYIPGLAPEFIPVLPHDPRESQPNPDTGWNGCSIAGENCYLYNSNGSDYKIIAHCTPEGSLSKDDPFADPCRINYAWQVSSSINAKGVLNAAETGCNNTGW